MPTGYIALHRKIREHWIWDNPEYLKWWIDLLLMVNHEPKKVLINGKPQIIEVGETHTSETKLSERWFASRTTVRNFLKTLEDDCMIEQKKSRQKGTTIKVRNYEAYQGKSEDEKTTNCTTIEQRKNNHIMNNNNENNIFSSEPNSDGAEIESKKPKKTGNPKKRVYEHESAYYRAAVWLADNIKKNNPGSVYPTEANLQSWADEARKLVELDNIGLDMFKRVLNFARNDDFWQTNILSMSTYRAKYNQLLAKYNAERSG